MDGVTYVCADALNAAIGSSASGGADGYVPLRDAAVAAGYEVFWDDAYQTVVLLDRAGFIAETDARFTVLNRALAAWAPEDGKNYQSTVDITAGYTKFNSLDGDQTWTMSAALTALSGAAGVELSGSYDLSSLMDILKAANPSLTQSTDDALPGQYSALLKGTSAPGWTRRTRCSICACPCSPPCSPSWASRTPRTCGSPSPWRAI